MGTKPKIMTEKFCLKWNDFHSNVSRSFNLVRNEEYLHDVTLVSDDHNKVSAHKLVLSTSSEYFRNIFKNNPHSHPLLCLDGISSEDIQNIMDYIYNGELQIYQENLDRFLVVAQKLKLQGLIENILPEKEEKVKNLPFIKEYVVEETEINEKVSNSKFEETTEAPTAVAVSNMDMQDIRGKINEYLIECDDKSYKCSLCGKMSNKNSRNTQKQGMQRHIETHLEGLSFTCTICQKEFKSTSSLSSHKSVYHR